MKKIKFLLMRDGASHKFLGINPFLGFEKYKSYEVALEYRHANINNVDNPDYIFVLKPKKEDVDKIFNKYKSSKKCLIISDERLAKEYENKFDFFVTCSQIWQQEFTKRHPSKKTYLIKEEYDYIQKKTHIEKTTNVVTMGYSVNLVRHFLKYSRDLNRYADSVTVVCESNKKQFESNKCLYQEFLAKNTEFLQRMWDKKAVTQFDKYDIGFIADNGRGRPATRGKAFLYAGLPIIAPLNSEYDDIWFNNSEIKILYYKNDNDIKRHLIKLRNPNYRNQIVDNNYNIIKKNYGWKRSAKSFIDAINDYEKDRKAN